MQIYVSIFLFIATLLPLQAQPALPLLPPLDLLSEQFVAETLDPNAWKPTASGRCSVEALDVADGWLRVRIGTLGDSDLVAWRGIRTTRPLRLSHPCVLSIDLDWNQQVNGCYLEAGIYLCPAATDLAPDVCSDWWKLAYIGVPPGENGRASSSVRLNGGERVLYDEGWPRQKSGRKIGLQRLTLQWDTDQLRVIENDRLLFSLPAGTIPFPEAYLYLQVKSHSNFPPRDIFFDNLEFQGH